MSVASPGVQISPSLFPFSILFLFPCSLSPLPLTRFPFQRNPLFSFSPLSFFLFLVVFMMEKFQFTLKKKNEPGIEDLQALVARLPQLPDLIHTFHSESLCGELKVR